MKEEEMRRISLILISVAPFVQGCAMERTATKDVDSRPCVANYSTKGEFWAGKQFKTFEDFPSAPKAATFDKLAAVIASSGYQIINSNKELGIISASQVASYGHGKTVPLNAVVTSRNPSGVRVELVFSLSGGLVTSADSVQEEFCKILASVSR